MTRILLYLLLLAPALVRAEEFDCLIEARQSVDIRSPVEGLLESVKVQRGDLVKAEAAYRRALRRDPNNRSAWEALQGIGAQGGGRR